MGIEIRKVASGCGLNQTMPRLRCVAARLILLAMCCLPSMLAQGATPANDRIARVDVIGTAMQIHLASGRVLAGKELVGVILTLKLPAGGESRRVRIDQVAIDPMDASGELLLYRMSLPDSPGSAAGDICDADPQGEHWVFPVQGQWDAQGTRTSSAGFTLTCSSGAQGKCVRFGYKPWVTTAEGVKMDEFHQACVRMVTAAYCGGEGTTRDGMAIDFYDSLGIQKPEDAAGSKPMRFEAAWDAHGALCVAHTRVPEKMSLEKLGKTCPRLRAKLGDAQCSDAQARAGRLGRVLIFNRSY